VPRLLDHGDPNLTIERLMHIKKPSKRDGQTETVPITVRFRPNRVTLEKGREIPGEDDVENEGDRTNLRAAQNFVDWVDWWDMDGPWDVGGERVADEGEMIPINRLDVVQSLPAWLTTGISREIIENVFPNLNASRRTRR
jgi:hypothetical protein